MAGQGSANQGHCHPKIMEAMVKQMSQLTNTTGLFVNNRIGEFEQKVCETLGFDKAIIMNGGTESGETAVKLARRWGVEVKGIDNDKVEVLFATNAYWGRSLAGCASSNDPLRYRGFGPHEGIGVNNRIPFNDTNALEKALGNNPSICAFMVEPIQGEAGYVVPDDGYLAKIREICDRHNVLLILDEI